MWTCEGLLHNAKVKIYTNPSMDKFVDTEHHQVTQALSSDSQYQGKSQECYTRDMKVLYTIQLSVGCEFLWTNLRCCSVRVDTGH
jgi:hypothetical protein